MNNTTEKKIRFAHFRSPVTGTGDGISCGPRGGCTIALKEDVDQQGGLVTLAAIKFCHPNDNFNRKEGRKKAGWLLDKLSYHQGQLKETTHVGYDRYYYRAGGFADTVPQLLAEVEQQTGYIRG